MINNMSSLSLSQALPIV